MVYKQQHNVARRVGQAIRFLLALTITAIMIFPLFWMLSTSLKTEAEVMGSQLVFWPEKMRFENFTYVIEKVPFFRYMLNTAVVTAMQMASELLLGIMAAYAFSKGKFHGKHLLFLLVLGAMMIPLQVTFIPLYVMVAQAGMMSTYWGVWIAGCVSSYTIFLLRQAFMTVDNSYLEAAHVDGMGKFATLFRIMVPMCKPTVITVALTAFMGGWNNYFWPKVIVKEQNMYLLTVGIQKLRTSYGGEVTNNYHQIMAGVLLSVIPVFIVFALFQRHMLSGFTKAAMK
ncbi:MAG TPA: carbohydrate ABC transporter permease [Candidatus Avichristensenella intestinipullorum]|uniref:Carbohydrate ABC transporter permease n=1 Tax=Candidatus Avichristensenella intestinipullorum TaxID=2840693 RepID=A0A9D1CIE9_9FIRM|nr:carbohydrate ABC transporter permease [Candidatus Avichristensenella intestinipullorum]